MNSGLARPIVDSRLRDNIRERVTELQTVDQIPEVIFSLMDAAGVDPRRVSLDEMKRIVTDAVCAFRSAAPPEHQRRAA